MTVAVIDRLVHRFIVPELDAVKLSAKAGVFRRQRKHLKSLTGIRTRASVVNPIQKCTVSGKHPGSLISTEVQKADRREAPNNSSIRADRSEGCAGINSRKGRNMAIHKARRLVGPPRRFHRFQPQHRPQQSPPQGPGRPNGGPGPVGGPQTQHSEGHGPGGGPNHGRPGGPP